MKYLFALTIVSNTKKKQQKHDFTHSHTHDWNRYQITKKISTLSLFWQVNFISEIESYRIQESSREREREKNN